MLALTLGNCSVRCSTSCIHAVVIPSPADAGEGELVKVDDSNWRERKASRGANCARFVIFEIDMYYSV